MQLSEEGECTYCSIGWHSDLSLHKHSICDQSVIGLEQLGPLNILFFSNRGLEIVGALNHLTLWGRESLSS
jgi:hypothetical protein